VTEKETRDFMLHLVSVTDAWCGGPKRNRCFLRKKRLSFQDRNTDEHHTEQKGTIRQKTTEGHRLNTQGNETQVETIRAWLETIRKETDKHRQA